MKLGAAILCAALLGPVALAQDAPAASPERLKTQKAAEAGDLQAAFILGRMFRDGVGGAEDRATARKWLKKAADGGHVRASVLLGLMLMAGEGGAQDRDAARPLMLFAAAAQDEDGLYWLGVLFAEGKVRNAGGPPQGASQAVFWFRNAATRGSIDGMYNMGLMHLKGLGTTRDPAEAYRWFLKAAEAGEAESQMIVARMLSDGQGVAADPKMALVWYYRAKGNGTVDDELEVALMKKLSADEIADAKRLAAQLPASPPQTP